MAASMRLRLHFDGNVCTQISPRKCWFLVNLDSCNVVADLEYLIRQRFELDRRLKIHLYLDDFLLPSMEKIHVVRDNDTLWIKLTEMESHLLQRLDEQSEESSSDPEKQQEKKRTSKPRKRKSHTRPETKQRKQKSRCNKHDSHLDQNTSDHRSVEFQTEGKNWGDRKQHSKKMKTDHPEKRLEAPSPLQTESNNVDKANTSLKSSTGSIQDHCEKSKKTSSQDSTRVTSVVKKTKRNKDVTERKSSSINQRKLKEDRTGDWSMLATSYHQLASGTESSVTEESEVQGMVSTQASGLMSNAPKHASSRDIVTDVASSLCQDENGKANVGQSSREETRTQNVVSKKKLKPICSAGHIRFESDSDSCSEDSAQASEGAKSQTSKEQSNAEKTLTNSEDQTPTGTDHLLGENRTTDESVPAPPANDIPELQPSPSGQFSIKEQFQNNSSSSPRKAFTARGRGVVKGNRGNWNKKNQLAANQTNKSTIVQNGPSEAVLPAKDFGSFQPLVGPPRQGDIIAYKILELSESYCPELSNFKEAKVLSIDPASGTVEVQLQSAAMLTKPSKPGKFDLPLEEGGEPQDVCNEEADQDLTICLQLQDLIDTRLVPSSA
ncbi:coilin-like [Acanthaster planci]|uniref:Coilin-like n=1 Tax=Acanthaster planci TaxID=133434 RepID=A0A8B7YVW8_ACAPL|nr:coilin-like [Acanthaster planci]